MKLSVILRTISITIFWAAIGMFVHWFFELEGKIPAVIFMSGLTALSTYFARIPKKTGFSFLFHLMALAVPGLFFVTGGVGIPVMLFGMGIVVISFIARLAESTSLDRGNGFGCVVLLIIYFVGSIMEYNMMWVHFGIMVAYVFLVFAESNIKQGEEYLEKVSYHSAVNTKKMSKVSYGVIMVITLGMLVVCLSIALLGMLEPLAMFSAFLCSKWRLLFRFLKRFKYEENEGETPNDENPFVPPEGETPQDEGKAQDIVINTEDIIAAAFVFTVVITCFLIVIYVIIKKIYKSYMQYQNEDIVEEHVNLKKNKKQNINTAKLDKSYNNRTAIRKIYKKRIKGKRFGRRDDLNNCTPMEQMNKSNMDGNEISNEFVEMYEKARYSNDEITKNDVKNMNKI